MFFLQMVSVLQRLHVWCPLPEAVCCNDLFLDVLRRLNSAMPVWCVPLRETQRKYWPFFPLGGLWFSMRVWSKRVWNKIKIRFGLRLEAPRKYTLQPAPRVST